MKRLFFFLSFLTLFLFFVSIKNSAFAFSCTIDPNPINDQDKKVQLSITSGGNLSTGSSNTYDIYIYPSFQPDCPFINGNCAAYAKNVPADSNGNLTFTANFTAYLSAGTEFTVATFPSGSTTRGLACDDMKLKVVQAVASGFCSPINIMPTTLLPSDNLIITPKDIASGADGSGNGPNDTHHIIIVNLSTGATVREFGAGGNNCPTGSQLATGFNISSYSTSDKGYQLYVKQCNWAGAFETEQCRATFTIGATGGTIITGNLAFVSGAPPPPPPCGDGSPGSQASGNTCITIQSAIGPIPTDLTGFIKIFFTVILSISGIIAILLIIISGYKLTTSQGNPDKVKEAREQLTAAIVGLLFIIFSLVALETIGVNILNLPGFGSLIKLP